MSLPPEGERRGRGGVYRLYLEPGRRKEGGVLYMYVSPPGRREEGVGECIECIDCIKNPEGGKREGSCICMSPGEEGKKSRGEEIV